MSEAVIIKTEQGSLQGAKSSTKSGVIYYRFLGIPYAKPPLGPLRFKASLPPDSWEGVRDATVDGPICSQIDFFKNNYKGQEDCLYLNVYALELPIYKTDLKKSVFVWIHGGNFTTGNGSSATLGPDFFVANDVVLVTFNFRMGPLGFLSTEDAEVPGNCGLKDQVMVLRWVQQNIAQFGGDPNNVTLAGESSGGACVHYHMLSSMSKGLFHRAIIQSGSVLNPWAFIQSPRSRAFKIGEALGCKSTNTKRLVDFLRKVPAERLLKALGKVQIEEETNRGYAFMRPTVEQEDNEEAFITEHPYEMVKNGKFHDVSLLTGYTSREGIYMLKEFFVKPAQMKVYNKNFELLCKEGIPYETTKEKLRQITRIIKHFYFGSKLLSTETFNEYAEMSTDIQILVGVYMHVKQQMQHSKSPVYLYRFSFDGKLAYFKPLINAKQFAGACHADDIGYLFPMPNIDPKLNSQSPEIKTRIRLVKMLTEFAKTGNPTPAEGDPLLNVVWKPATKNVMNFIDIDCELSMGRDPDKERIEMWNEVYRLVEL